MKNSSEKNKKLIYFVVVLIIAVITSVGSSLGWWGDLSEDPGNTLGNNNVSSNENENNSGFSIHFKFCLRTS